MKPSALHRRFVSDGLPLDLPPQNHESPTDPARFERATLGSGGARNGPVEQGETLAICPPVAPLQNALEVHDLACVVLTQISAANALALADAVLADERVRLALEVREGGPHAVRRAIELAALVLADASPAEVRLAH